VEQAVGGIVGKADMGNGGTGSQRDLEWDAESGGEEGISNDRVGRLILLGTGGSGRIPFLYRW